MIARAPVALLFALGVAGAEPITEPGPEQVTIPKAMLLDLIRSYQEQKAANVLLWERQEEINLRLERWRKGTNCT